MVTVLPAGGPAAGGFVPEPEELRAAASEPAATRTPAFEGVS
jgi:hypothetical protein